MNWKKISVSAAENRINFIVGSCNKNENKNNQVNTELAHEKFEQLINRSTDRLANQYIRLSSVNIFDWNLDQWLAHEVNEADFPKKTETERSTHKQMANNKVQSFHQ